MEIRRTANAGVLLKLDGATVLMDGVCREVSPYPATPPEERQALMRCWPDVIAFSHTHEDHYDPDFTAEFIKQTGGVILGPGCIPGAKDEPWTGKGITVTPIPSRHIGAAGKTVTHRSFLICGSRTVLFTGDAAPSQFADRQDLPKIDVLIAPFAYANSGGGWAVTRKLDPDTVVIVHMPRREKDTVGLWEAVEKTTGAEPPLIPAMGQTIQL